MMRSHNPSPRVVPKPRGKHNGCSITSVISSQNPVVRLSNAVDSDGRTRARIAIQGGPFPPKVYKMPIESYQRSSRLIDINLNERKAWEGNIDYAVSLVDHTLFVANASGATGSEV